nr:HTTM domain-containing protein [Kroppenstedtia pulmonis]
MLIGVSLLRICFGLILLYFYLIHYGQRYFLWGPNGMIEHKDFLKYISINYKLSIFNFSSSVLYFDLIFHLGIVFAILFTIGYKGRIVSVINFIFVWSIFSRNGIILDGGDNIMRIILVYLMFADTTAYFSVDRKLMDKKCIKPVHIRDNIRISFYIHNMAILACIVQVCMVYITSGFHKAMGELWQEGVAIYYILQVGEYTHPLIENLITNSDAIMVLGSYSTVLVQIAFPFLLFNRITKYIAMAGIITMHIGIAIGMGLVSFSAVMISIQLLMLTDFEYQKIRNKLFKVKQYVKSCIPKKKNDQKSFHLRP